MRIPHVVSKVVMGAYIPTQEELDAMEEADKISFPAADFIWDSHIVPSLRFLVIQRLSQIFQLVQPLIDKEDSGILQQDIDTLMEILPIDVDLKLTVPAINYEIYWERCCKERWPAINIIHKNKKQFWKYKYLVMCLEEHLETAKPKDFNADETAELTELLQEYIDFLNIKQLQVTECPPMPNCRDGIIRDECIRLDLDIPLDHIPLEKPLSKLQNLTQLRIVFSVQNLLDKFDWRAFKFSIADCESICAGLEALPHIKVLCINKTLLDSERITVFLRFIAQKDSIEEIDFSDCHVGDGGLITLGGLLMEHSSLKVIRMRNNKFGEEGLKGFSNALQKDFNAPLITLDELKAMGEREFIDDFGMNFMTDVGANYLAAGLVRCKEKPSEVIISSCCLRGFAAMSISRMVRYNTCILKLDISVNDLTGEAESLMMEAMEENKHILEIDLRQTDISEENTERIREKLKRNKEIRDNHIEIIDREIPPLYMEDPEYLIWEYNPTNPEYEPGHYPPRIIGE